MKKLLLMCLFLIITSNLLSQGVLYNEEFIINTDTFKSQYNPSVTGLSNGGFVVSWISYGRGIMAQIFDANGLKVGSEFNVSNNNIDSRSHVQITSQSNGTFIVVWNSLSYVDVRHEIEKAEIKGQIFDESGAKIGFEFEIGEYEGAWSNYLNVKVDELIDGKFAVCWYVVEQKTIFTKIIDAKNGFAIDNGLTSFEIVNAGINSMNISGISNGGFVVCWNDFEGVFAKVFDSQYRMISNDISITYGGEWNNDFADVEKVSNGGFLLTWIHNFREDTPSEIIVQNYDINGEKVGNEIIINASVSVSKVSSRICEISPNQFIIYWMNKKNWSDVFGISAQLFDIHGVKNGAEFEVAKGIRDVGFLSHDISSLIDGRFIICWTTQETYGDGSGDGVSGKLYLGEPINHNLTSFALLEPDYDATISNPTPRFSWNNVTQTHINFQWEINYDLFIDTDESFSNPMIIESIQDTTYQIDSLTSGKTYFWKVLAKNIAGDSLWSSNINGFYIDENATDVELFEPQFPTKFELSQNYPNPFNPTTKIKYTIAKSPLLGGNGRGGFVTLKVYDILGKEVAILLNKYQSAGSYEVEFDAENLPSGIYFYRIITDKFSETKKMILMR